MIDETFDIEVGDIVATSYGSGPYIVVSVGGPYDWRYDGKFDRVPAESPHWGLTLKGAPGSDYAKQDPRGRYYINDIHRPKEGRYFTVRGDEVYVAKPLNRWAMANPVQLPLFAREGISSRRIIT